MLTNQLMQKAELTRDSIHLKKNDYLKKKNKIIECSFWFTFKPGIV